MNLVAITKFIHIIYDIIFMSLFSISQIKEGLLRSILNYFGIVQINNCGILYLYYFIWLKSILYLIILQM